MGLRHYNHYMENLKQHAEFFCELVNPRIIESFVGFFCFEKNVFFVFCFTHFFRKFETPQNITGTCFDGAIKMIVYFLLFQKEIIQITTKNVRFHFYFLRDNASVIPNFDVVERKTPSLEFYIKPRHHL